MISFNMSGLTDTEVTDLIKNRSGWGVYRDSIHTSASPQTISQGTTSILTNNANTSIITELPDEQPMYDGVNNKFLPLSLNDYYLWIVRFKAKNSQGNGGYIDLGIDIGGTFGTIFTESHIFIRGANVEQTFSDVKHKSIRIHISENPAIETAGIAYMTDTECAIVLKQYPVCLLHEIRHCLEWQWHGDSNSSEDCY